MSAISPPRPAGPGLLEALKAIAATLEGTVRLRGEVFALELREEASRRKSRLVLAIAAGILLHTALLLATALIAVVLWDSHRVAAIGVMAALYSAGGAGLVVLLRAKAAASPEPFARTLRGLDGDLASLRGQASALGDAFRWRGAALSIPGLVRTARFAATAIRVMFVAKLALSLLRHARALAASRGRIR
ncbi:MAG TPA: phage holin family protein [Usitatibacter sp.]|nr:phage holin family protein [Usitatibacter sp.]